MTFHALLFIAQVTLAVITSVREKEKHGTRQKKNYHEKKREDFLLKRELATLNSIPHKLNVLALQCLGNRADGLRNRNIVGNWKCLPSVRERQKK